MNILALDTATDYCSVALSISGHGQGLTDYTVKGRGVHSEAVFKGIEYVLEKRQLVPDDIDVILLSEGPGSYTGLRVGYSAAKGFLFGHVTKLYTINTLLSIAAGISAVYNGIEVFHIVLDARRNHLIHQSFKLKDGFINPMNEINIIPISGLPDIISRNGLLTGTGLHRIDAAKLPGVQIIRDFPVEARYLFGVWNMHLENPGSGLVRETDPAVIEPVYLTPGI
jgi:tRNA threonylcarbamoyladenosine biosynthesis protein TsaB